MNMKDHYMDMEYDLLDSKGVEEDCGSGSQPNHFFSDEINFYREQTFNNKKMLKILRDGALMRQSFDFFTKKSCSKFFKVKCVSYGCGWLLRAKKYE